MLGWSTILRRTTDRLVSTSRPKSASRQAQRAATRFELAAAAGELATAKIDEHGPRPMIQLGFRKTLEHDLGDALHTNTTYYVLPEAWCSEVFNGMNLNAINKELLS